MKTPKLLLSIAVVTAGILTVNSFAQKSEKHTASRSLKSTGSTATISTGVVNGRAVELFVPTFPIAANAVGVYGVVVVQVLIETDGKVISAIAISGHPLLRNSSVNAALKSRFTPMNVGGAMVRVSGSIHYNYFPDQRNWLELGLSLNTTRSSFYSNSSEKSYFPAGFENEWNLLIMESENRAERVESVIASIKGKLLNDPKSSWLFSLGLTLGSIKKYREELDLERQFNELKVLLLSKPINVSNVLSKKLEAVILEFEIQKANGSELKYICHYNQTLHEIEQNLPMLGR